MLNGEEINSPPLALPTGENMDELKSEILNINFSNEVEK